MNDPNILIPVVTLVALAGAIITIYTKWNKSGALIEGSALLYLAWHFRHGAPYLTIAAIILAALTMGTPFTKALLDHAAKRAERKVTAKKAAE